MEYWRALRRVASVTTISFPFAEGFPSFEEPQVVAKSRISKAETRKWLNWAWWKRNSFVELSRPAKICTVFAATSTDVVQISKGASVRKLVQRKAREIRVRSRLARKERMVRAK